MMRKIRSMKHHDETFLTILRKRKRERINRELATRLVRPCTAEEMILVLRSLRGLNVTEREEELLGKTQKKEIVLC